ncbi:MULTISPECIES: hypothetical protein [unclassified Streptomyces]|uniref:hypothetical protein n=1 Tax=unclassified Streptomyces TaxID=2593676 RepID=UPI00278BC07D|nr:MULTISPECIES: hypothetical protein [unclassified Streptomyces]
MTAPTAVSAPVPVTLDLRGFRRIPRSTDECAALWQRIEPAVLTVDPRVGPRVLFDLGEEGEVGVWFLDPAAAPLPLAPATRFAVRGVLEPPEVRHACTTCRAAGTTTYAPYRCSGCDQERRPGRVCEAHALFIEGGLRASCGAHAPHCRCGTRAVAWCGGTRCRTRKAWCATHLRRHPGDATVVYCHDCYADRFPVCERGQCEGTGYIRCEHRTLASMSPCGRQICAEHAQRWQVYGPYSRGLALCSRHHQRLRSTSPEGLIDIVLAGTVARGGGHRGRSASRRRVELPRISIVRHILINTRRTVLDMESIDRLFTDLQRTLRARAADKNAKDDTAAAAVRLIDRHAASRREDIERFREQHVEGRGHFDRMVQQLRRGGQRELAGAVTFSDYRPRSRILFVRVPGRLRSAFLGPGGATVKDLERRVGVDIKLERG